jgi:D-psicose/D-tagatose/L-ribulose 3-epimerase
MELSIHNWMRAEPIEKTIQRIAALGYEKIEIQGTPEQELSETPLVPAMW